MDGERKGVMVMARPRLKGEEGEMGATTRMRVARRRWVRGVVCLWGAAILVIAMGSGVAWGGSPEIYAPDGTYLGELNGNQYDPNSVADPYGQYGSPYAPNSINDPYGKYGSPYSPDSATNPYTVTLPAPPVVLPMGPGCCR